MQVPPAVEVEPDAVLSHEIRALKATGMRTPSGFVVFAGSQAVSKERKSAAQYFPWIVDRRQELKADGGFVAEGDHLVLTRDVEFPSPSNAAGVLEGGGVNGLIAWRDASGKTLKEIEAKEVE